MKNIAENITYSSEKANVFQLKKSDKLKYFAVALGKNGVLKKHTAPVPSTLVVLKGEINFVMENEQFHFRQFDVYEIPVAVEHEVTGISDENLFTVAQEL